MTLLGLGAATVASSACAPTSSGTVLCPLTVQTIAGARLVEPAPNGTPAPRAIGRLVLDTSGTVQPSGQLFDVTDPAGTIIATIPLTIPSPLPSGLPSASPGAPAPVYRSLAVPVLPASTTLTVQERAISGTTCENEQFRSSGSFETASM